jgi:hypothetical protein
VLAVGPHVPHDGRHPANTCTIIRYCASRNMCPSPFLVGCSDLRCALPFEYVHIFAVYGIAVHSCMVTLSCAADVLSMECMLP